MSIKIKFFKMFLTLTGLVMIGCSGHLYLHPLNHVPVPDTSWQVNTSAGFERAGKNLQLSLSFPKKLSLSIYYLKENNKYNEDIPKGNVNEYLQGCIGYYSTNLFKIKLNLEILAGIGFGNSLYEYYDEVVNLSDNGYSNITTKVFKHKYNNYFLQGNICKTYPLSKDFRLIIIFSTKLNSLVFKKFQWNEKKIELWEYYYLDSADYKTNNSENKQNENNKILFTENVVNSVGIGYKFLEVYYHFGLSYPLLNELSEYGTPSHLLYGISANIRFDSGKFNDLKKQ